MNLSEINHLAVLVAALSSFLIGGVWYSPLLFAGSWAAMNGLSDETLKQGNMLKIFGGAFFLALVMAYNLAAFLGPRPTVAFGVGAGVAAGLGWVAAALGVTYLFERKPWKLFAINAGYHVVAFALMGVILGAMS
jgi:Protein of unknown function (DUF1761)